MDRYYYDILDTGMLNECLKGYVGIAMHRAGLDEEAREEVMNGLRDALDLYTTEEARDFYFNGFDNGDELSR